MNFTELAKNRYSERRFSSKALDDEKLSLILDAGMLAPTGVNWQPQRMLVVSTAEGMKKLADCTPFVYGAPAAVIICYDKNACWRSPDGRDVGVIDSTLVMSHMMFEAEELGVHTLIVAGFREKELRDNFDIPEYIVPVAILMLGYPSERSHPHHKLHFERKKAEDVTWYGSFSGITPAEDLNDTHKIL